MNTEMKQRSAVLKLQLLIHGINISPSALYGLGSTYKEYQYGYNDSSWLHQEVGTLIPSELMLPGDIVVAPHLRPTSPYLIDRVKEQLVIKLIATNEVVSQVNYLPRPKFWNIRLSNGEYVKKCLNVYGKDCLNLFLTGECEFWEKGLPCCFCSLKPTQQRHHETVVHKDIDLISEAFSKATTSGDDLKWMIITGGSSCDRNIESLKYLNVLQTIKPLIPASWGGRIKGNCAFLPGTDKEILREIHATGIEHPSFNLEVWGEERFERLCPGKARYANFRDLIQSYKTAVDIWGPGKVWCNFVGGITPIEELCTGFKYMADLGVVPGCNIFHLDPNATAVRLGITGPNEKYIMDMYHCLSNIYHTYNYTPFFSHSVLRNSLSNECYYGWV